MKDTDLEGDVHSADDMRMAWFKDPDGNILCVVGTS
ncbi:MAG: VOC family protein [Alphaproteobacteria bacterium]